MPEAMGYGGVYRITITHSASRSYNWNTIPYNYLGYNY